MDHLLRIGPITEQHLRLLPRLLREHLVALLHVGAALTTFAEHVLRHAQVPPHGRHIPLQNAQLQRVQHRVKVPHDEVMRTGVVPLPRGTAHERPCVRPAPDISQAAFGGAVADASAGGTHPPGVLGIGHAVPGLRRGVQVVLLRRVHEVLLECHSDLEDVLPVAVLEARAAPEAALPLLVGGDARRTVCALDMGVARVVPVPVARHHALAALQVVDAEPAGLPLQAVGVLIVWDFAAAEGVQLLHGVDILAFVHLAHISLE
mmetsp:Transcript_77349/g.129052  ORF Transcript_77349/g.129052 Transcript_77349/m.129052 type:complete len:262 (+) Transcript_77349:1606-2391(+)